ncbi:MAG TPA: translation elongation factor Ts [Blastocatellia bacterium]|nr:translation elongation factor Ts [Blastocatellia bacterium]
MAEISAQAVKDLREKTGAGMMDCKKALTEAGGDMEKAIEVLRKRGLAAAQKRQGRTAAEGLVAALITNNGSTGVLTEVNCETDFVARGEEFQSLVNTIAQAIAANNPDSVEAALALKAGDKTIGDLITEKVAKIGENITLRRFTRYEKQGSGVIGSYIHMGGKIGVLVEVGVQDEKVASSPAFAELVKDLAMHITAAEPRFVHKGEVPGEVLDKEREIARAQALQDPKNANKPAQVIDKIVEGRLSKFYAEACLLEQPFIRDQAITANDLIAGKCKEHGTDITIRRFTRYKMGEGLEKRSDDFAGEVAATLQ